MNSNITALQSNVTTLTANITELTNSVTNIENHRKNTLLASISVAKAADISVPLSDDYTNYDMILFVLSANSTTVQRRSTASFTPDIITTAVDANTSISVLSMYSTGYYASCALYVVSNTELHTVKGCTTCVGWTSAMTLEIYGINY